MGKIIKTETKEKVIDYYNSGIPMLEIFKLLDISEFTCRKIFRENRIPTFSVKRPRKYNLDETFFDEIDTEEKAYWLGFLAADGSISDSGCLKLQLATKDLGHIQRFKEAISSNHAIKRNQTTLSNGKTYYGYGISFTNARMAKSLNEKGIIPRKSLIMRPYLNIDENLMRHYWRGIIDGDGCIEDKTNYKGVGRNRLSLAGSIDTVTAFAAWCDRHAVVNKKFKKHGNIYYFTIDKKESICRILKILYEETKISLYRKEMVATGLIDKLARFLTDDINNA